MKNEYYIVVFSSLLDISE